MSGAAKVSIIVPVYNVKEYLPRCLESCIQQTLYDIEIICVDDGSTDESGKILDTYEKLDARIHIIHKLKGGLSSARNAGYNAATGKWIMYLDSDDFLEENACERVWLETLEADTDIVVFGSRTFPSVPKANGWYERVLHPSTQRFHTFKPEVLFSTIGSTPFVWRQAFSKKLLSSNNIRFYEGTRFGEDLIYQMEVFPMAENFSFIEDEIYNYRWYREDSLMGKMKNQQDDKMRQHLLIKEEITRYWQDKKLLDEYAPEYLAWMLNFMVPDLTSPKLKQADEHARALVELVCRYELDEVVPKEKSEVKALWRKLKKMC